MSKQSIDGLGVQSIWSVENDPLFDPADSHAAVYRDAGGQHYLTVDHWGGGRHVMRITSAEAGRIVGSNNYRLILWGHMAAQIEAADRGDWERAERLEAEMRLRWEVRV